MAGKGSRTAGESRAAQGRMAKVLLVANVSMGSALAPGLLDGALASTKAGVSAAVRGSVELARAEAPARRPLVSGEDVFMGDAIATGDAAGLQLLLLDESVFTIGPNAEIVVDEFVYDPATGTGKLSASFLRGGFRLVSGLIGKTEPENIEVQLPTATVGVRGTSVVFLVTADAIYVVLEGPGPDNSALAREGAVEIKVGDETALLYRPGFVVRIPLDGSGPSQPYRPDAAFLALVREKLGLDFASGDPGAREPSEPVIDSDIRTADLLEVLELFEESAGRDEDFEELVIREIDEEEIQGYMEYVID